MCTAGNPKAISRGDNMKFSLVNKAEPTKVPLGAKMTGCIKRRASDLDCGSPLPRSMVLRTRRIDIYTLGIQSAALTSADCVACVNNVLGNGTSQKAVADYRSPSRWRDGWTRFRNSYFRPN